MLIFCHTLPQISCINVKNSPAVDQYSRHAFRIYHPKADTMMTQFDVSTWLVEQLPGIRTDLNYSYPTLNIFRTIRCLVNHTRGKLEQHDMEGVKNCLDKAEYIYARGNKPVKNVMENIFVHSFSHLFSMGSSDERKELQSLMPLHLYCAYVKRLI